MLASWRFFASCAPHDHGFSTGTVLVVEGQFEELSYKWSSDSGDIKADLQSLRRASKGQFLEVEGDTFHSMKNVGQTGITLHFYTPAISNMKVLDLRNKQTLTVSEDCGAWIPTDLHKIKGIQKWQKTQIG
jgi:cysteine dioxygenase